MSAGGIGSGDRPVGARIRAGLLCALLVALAGCGAEDSTATDPQAASPTATGSASASASGLPRCDDVWQAGARLPRGYDGCLDGQRTVEPDGRYCEFGKPLVTFDERFYAVPGGRIAEAEQPFASDPAYQRVLASCSG